MKSKIFKPMAVALTMAVGLGTTAMAASVTTTTDYTFGADSAAVVTVTTNITGAVANSQVTFLVADGDVSDDGSIVYIDQAGTGSGTTVDFSFKAKQSDLYKPNVVAKFGTDNDGNTDLKPFEFNDGVDYITNGNAEVTKIPTSNFEFDENDEDLVNDGYSVVGKFSGNVSEYGMYLWRNPEGSNGNPVEYYFPAYASENGVFVVSVDTVGSVAFADDIRFNCEPYVKDADGNIIHIQSVE